MVLCGQLQEKGGAAVNISVKNSKFELHVALGLLFLFGFNKCGLWQVYSMHKSNIKEILVTKTCSQENVKSGSDSTKRLAESKKSANLVQSLSYSKQVMI